MSNYITEMKGFLSDFETKEIHGNISDRDKQDLSDLLENPPKKKLVWTMNMKNAEKSARQSAGDSPKRGMRKSIEVTRNAAKSKGFGDYSALYVDGDVLNSCFD